MEKGANSQRETNCSKTLPGSRSRCVGIGHTMFSAPQKTTFLPLLPLISLQPWENTPVFVNLLPERVYNPATCTIECGTHSRP